MTFEDWKKMQSFLSSLFKELEMNRYVIVTYKVLNILVDVELSINSINQFITFCSFWMIINNTIMSELNYAKT